MRRLIWPAYDSRRRSVHYLNPIIFLRPVEFSLKSPDNMSWVGILIIVFIIRVIYSQIYD